FSARHNLSGIFTFVDEKVTGLTGHRTTDLLGRCLFDFCHDDDLMSLQDVFKQMLVNKDHVINATFRMITKDYISLKISCSTFINPYTNAVEYISCTYKNAKSN
ncbi:hypothetical protein HELRODRAFT_137275, partial [Helobdella robusta]|uniref:PAS domain-containing protein n=1 Tax=Helobdella robusta TaxID=6412 RepID=T1EII7_HELRO